MAAPSGQLAIAAWQARLKDGSLTGEWALDPHQSSIRPLSFDAEVSGRDDGEVGLDAEVRINRADFGLTWNVMGLAAMTATVTIHAAFIATEHR
jgi:hypothetical protein